MRLEEACAHTVRRPHGHCLSRPWSCHSLVTADPDPRIVPDLTRLAQTRHNEKLSVKLAKLVMQRPIYATLNIRTCTRMYAHINKCSETCVVTQTYTCTCYIHKNIHIVFVADTNGYLEVYMHTCVRVSTHVHAYMLVHARACVHKRMYMRAAFRD